MGFRGKLLTSYAVIISIFIVIGLIYFTQLDNFKKDLKLLNEAREIEVSLAMSESALKSYLILGEADYLNEYTRLAGQTNQHVDKLSQLAGQEETKKLVNQIKECMKMYDEYTQQILLLKQAGQTEELNKYMCENQYVVKNFYEAVIKVVNFA